MMMMMVWTEEVSEEDTSACAAIFSVPQLFSSVTKRLSLGISLQFLIKIKS
jgi:hypothetical protein